MAEDPTTPKNRRASERRRPRTTLRVECRKGWMGLGPNIAVRLLDMSETGVRMIVKTHLQTKDEIEILFSGGGLAKQVKRIGNIVWGVDCDEGQCVGIHFQKSLEYRVIQNFAAPR